VTNNRDTQFGVAQAGSREAADAALEILESGGNAIDGAVSALLMLSVRGIGTTCIGGEVPALIYDAKSESVKALSGQGAAPMSQAATDWYLGHGIVAGGIRSATVPSMVDLCVQALRLYGTLTFADVSRAAVTALETGGNNWYEDTASGRLVCGLSGQLFGKELLPLDFAGRNWHADLARTFRKLIEAEEDALGNREERIQAVADRFYRGDIAEELCQWYLERGGFLRKADLAGHVTRVEEPISVDYRGYTLYKCGSWTQGPYLAQALRLLEGWDVSRLELLGTDYIHLVTEASNLAIADRDEYYGDPLVVDVPMQELLSDEYTEMRRSLIDMRSASSMTRPGDPRNMRPLIDATSVDASNPPGTTTCAVADRWGNVVVATPSGVGSIAGSGGKTGVTHGTRLAQFNTIAAHPNCIAPGKRPRTTLSPSMILKDNKPAFALGIPGGDLQDQAALQMILAMVDFKHDRKTVWSLPRFYTRPQSKETVLRRLKLPDSIHEATRSELTGRGHAVTTLRRDVGGISMISFDSTNGEFDFVGDAPGGVTARL
jgi:gamma-glutamyltranspeptidase/glutathione hydrolase